MGLPMAALLIRREYDQWAPGEHNGTFRGHNPAFVGGSAALDIWADPHFGPHIRELGEAIGARLADIVADLPPGTAEIVGRGTMRGLRFADTETADRVQRNLFPASVVAETSGRGHVLKLLPPLTMTTGEWKEVADTLVEVVTDTVNGSGILPTG